MAQSMINNPSVFERASITVVFVASWCRIVQCGVSTPQVLALPIGDHAQVPPIFYSRIMFTMMDILWLNA